MKKNILVTGGAGFTYFNYDQRIRGKHRIVYDLVSERNQVYIHTYFK